MCKLFTKMLLVVVCAGLLQACITPVARVNWYTDPGMAPPANCHPGTPYCQTYN